MNARFLREEAARFRGMADDTDRAATKDRFLAMAIDYDARAKVAHESEALNSGVADQTTAGVDPGEANGDVVGPIQDEAPRITPGRKIAAGLNETVAVPRRSPGRPRRE
jgi:hypothetical protein